MNWRELKTHWIKGKLNTNFSKTASKLVFFSFLVLYQYVCSMEIRVLSPCNTFSKVFMLLVCENVDKSNAYQKFLILMLHPIC